MSARLTAAIIILIAIVYAAFMARVLFDDNFRPPAEIAALGPLLLTGALGINFAKARKGDE